MSQSTIRILRRGQHLSYLATLVPWGRAGATPLESVCQDIYCGWQDPESLGKALGGRLVEMCPGLSVCFSKMGMLSPLADKGSEGKVRCEQREGWGP